MRTLKECWDDFFEQSSWLSERELDVDGDAVLADAEPVGKGSQSEVFKATIDGVDRAVSVFSFASLGVEDDLRRIDEAVTLENLVGRIVRSYSNAFELDHPHIERIYGHFMIDDPVNPKFCKVKEWLGGGPLTQTLRRYNERAHTDEYRLLRDGDASHLLRSFYGLSSALVYLGRYGFVHRDIKPGNMCFDDEGNLKLIDFGIGKLVDDVTDLTNATGIGSPNFSAPEQLSEGVVSPAADIYSFGKVLFHAFIGDTGGTADSDLKRSPGFLDFERANAKRMRTKMQAQGVSGLEDVLYRTLHSESARRASAEELQEMLGRVVEGKSPYRLFSGPRSWHAERSYVKSKESSEARMSRRLRNLAVASGGAVMLLAAQGAEVLYDQYKARRHDVTRVVEGRVSPEEAADALEIFAKNQVLLNEKNRVEEYTVGLLHQVPIATRVNFGGRYHTSISEAAYSGHFMELQLSLSQHATGRAKEDLERISGKLLSLLYVDYSDGRSDADHWQRTRFGLVPRHYDRIQDIVDEGYLSEEKLEELEEDTKDLLCLTLQQVPSENDYLLRGETRSLEFLRSALSWEQFDDVLAGCEEFSTKDQYHERIIDAGLHYLQLQDSGRLAAVDDEIKIGFRPLHQSFGLSLLLSSYSSALETGSSSRGALAAGIEENLLRQFSAGEDGRFSDDLFLDSGLERVVDYWRRLGYRAEHGGLIYATSSSLRLLHLAEEDGRVRDDLGAVLPRAESYAENSLSYLFEQGTFPNPVEGLSEENVSGLVGNVFFNTKYSPFVGSAIGVDLELVRVLEGIKNEEK